MLVIDKTPGSSFSVSKARALCSRQHEFALIFCVWSSHHCSPAGGAPQQSKQILIAGTWGPDLGRFPWHLVKAPDVCLQQCLLHLKRKCCFRIAKTALKLPTTEKAGDVALSHASSLARIAREQPLPEAPVFTFSYDSVVLPLQQKKTCQNPILVTLYTPDSSNYFSFLFSNQFSFLIGS